MTLLTIGHSQEWGAGFGILSMQNRKEKPKEYLHVRMRTLSSHLNCYQQQSGVKGWMRVGCTRARKNVDKYVPFGFSRGKVSRDG